MNQQNKIVGVIGAKGSGKTYYAKRLFSESEHAIVIDTMGEYDSGFIVSDPHYMIQHLKNQKRFRIVFLPLSESDFEFACRAARAKGNLTLFIEEVHNYCTPHSINPQLQKVIRLGRHSNLDVVYTAQRYQDISRQVTAQTDEFVLFRISEPVDFQAIEKRFGSGVAEKVSRLQDHDFVNINVKEFRYAHSDLGGVRPGDRLAPSDAGSESVDEGNGNVASERIE